MRNKFMQLLTLLTRVGASNKQEYKDKVAEKKLPYSTSLSMFAEGVNPAGLSLKRVKGKWKVKR